MHLIGEEYFMWKVCILCIVYGAAPHASAMNAVSEWVDCKAFFFIIGWI